MAASGNDSEPTERWTLLRAADQVVVATCLLVALIAMAAWWFANGGHRGELIEIDRAGPLEPQFAVDINAADWPELTLLPEVGETLAKRIVASREALGPFLDHRDLMRVEGIGPLTLEAVSPYLLPMPDAENVAGGELPGEMIVN
jgi:competence protein ComEA